MENLKCRVLSGICVLLLVPVLFVRPSLSDTLNETLNETLTEECQWKKLLCAFFTGVDISVHHMSPNSEIPELAVLDRVLGLMRLESETIVPILATQSFDGNLMTDVMGSQSYYYRPRLTVVIDDRDNIFFSEPGSEKGSNRHHAESQILRFLNDTGQLKNTSYFNVSNSPCQDCAREFVTFFKDIPEKPTINFLGVYGKGSPPEEADKHYKEALLSLKDLKREGFKIGLWDGTNLIEVLKKYAPTSYDRDILQDSLNKYAEKINKRAKITEDDIRTINNHNISPLGLNKTDMTVVVMMVTVIVVMMIVVMVATNARQKSGHSTPFLYQ